VPLAIFLGHAYDDSLFMATGYFVSSGMNPYMIHSFPSVFNGLHLFGAFSSLPSIGYFPPWPLLLGLIYRVSFNVTSNIFLYNFAIKIPVIVGNVCLAFLMKNLIVKLYGNDKKARFAWLFILFNPFILLTTVAWGEFDTIVAFLCVASLYLSITGKVKESAVSMALGVALKPVGFPLVGLPLILPSLNARKRVEYLLIFAAVLGACYFIPFYLEGWALPWTLNDWTSHLRMAGGLTPFNLLELHNGSVTLPISFSFLGYLWMPALLLGYLAVYRNRPNSMTSLGKKAVILTLIFFLTRSWLSETNINLLLVLMLLVISTEKLSFRNFHFAWVIPLIFMFLNLSFPQLFFLIQPSVISSLSQLSRQIENVRLLSRFLITLIWQILAWNFVINHLRRKPSNLQQERAANSICTKPTC
jgi:hypothetical protein